MLANIWMLKFELFSYCFPETYVVDAQKNRLTETVLLSTHTIVLVEK